MNDKDDALNLIGESKGFIGVNHNPINYESYRKFQEELDSKFAPLEEDRKRIECKANLRKWQQKLSKPWNQARLKNVKDVEAARKARELIQQYGFCSLDRKSVV